MPTRSQTVDAVAAPVATMTGKTAEKATIGIFDAVEDAEPEMRSARRRSWVRDCRSTRAGRRTSARAEARDDDADSDARDRGHGETGKGPCHGQAERRPAYRLKIVSLQSRSRTDDKAGAAGNRRRNASARPLPTRPRGRMTDEERRSRRRRSARLRFTLSILRSAPHQRRDRPVGKRSQRRDGDDDGKHGVIDAALRQGRR